MKIAVVIMVAVVLMCEVARAAPANNDRPDPMLAELLAGASTDSVTRNARQSQEPMSPLGQLLQDALAIPQVALQAVSRLLTNPRNTIGQSTGARNSYT